ncbi:MAG: hypothetical protein ACR2P2_17270 [Nakamurella sp.]
MNTALNQLGNEIENAVRANLAAAGTPASIDRPTGRSWRRKAVVIPAAAVLALGAGVGTAAAAGLFSSPARSPRG